MGLEMGLMLNTPLQLGRGFDEKYLALGVIREPGRELSTYEQRMCLPRVDRRVYCSSHHSDRVSEYDNPVAVFKGTTLADR